MKILLSYPRSGNHLVRFFMELLSEQPTLGVMNNVKDRPIFENIFSENIPFNIDSIDNYDIDNLYVKSHVPPTPTNKPTELIFIVRNPQEVLLRNLNYKFKTNGWDGYDNYFKNIDYFINFDGKKLCLYYENIITEPIQFIEEIYNFLDIKNKSKKDYVIQNIDKLYELSKNGKNRIWGGVNSNSIHYYYDKIKLEDKELFDNYIQSKLNTNKYDLIKNKYNLHY